MKKLLKLFVFHCLLYTICFSILSIDQCIAQWQKTNLSYDGSIYCIAIKGTNIFAGTDGGGLFLSTNNGISWSSINQGLLKDTITSLAINDSNIFAGAYFGGVFLSTNNSLNWIAINNGIPDKASVYALAISGINIFAGTDKGVYLSTNNGLSWTEKNNGIKNDTVTSLAINGNNIYAGTLGVGKGVFFSNNNGNSWIPISYKFGKVNVSEIYSLAISGENIIAGTGTYAGMFISSNNGYSWNGVNQNLFEVLALAVSNKNVFAGGFAGKGVNISNDNGISWYSWNNGWTEPKNIWAYPNVYSLVISGNYIYAGTYEAGLLIRSLSDKIGNLIQGMISYDNQYNSQLKNTKLYLINSEDKAIDSTITDTLGHYVFTGVANGNYTIQPKITIPWGGVNPADALIINRNYIGIYKFSDNLLKTAADVNGDIKVDPKDALIINRRYIGIINKYKINDWLYEKPVITVTGKDIIKNIKVVCTGDVNGSHKF